MLIKQKLAILFLLVAILPVIIVGLVLTSRYEKSLLESYYSRLNIIADYKKDKIETLFKDMKVNILITQEYYNIKKNLPILTQFAENRSQPEYLQAKEMLDRQLQTWLKAKEEMIDFMLVSPQGKIVYALNEHHQKHDIDQPLLDPGGKAFEEGKSGVYISQIFKNADPVLGYKYGILIVAPIKDFDGSFAGVVAFEVNMDAVYRYIQDSSGLGKTGETLLARKEGDHVLFLSPLRFDQEAALVRTIPLANQNIKPAQKAGNKVDGFGKLIDYRNIEVFAAWRYIPILDIDLVAKIDSREIFELVGALRNFVVLFCVIILLLVGLTATATAFTIAVPIENLRKGAEEIGKGNLDHHVATNSKDEIGQLSKEFDRMVAHLKLTMTSRAELEAEIVKRRKSEESNIRLSQAVVQSSAVIVITDPDGTIEYVNPAFERVTGYSSQEAIGKNPRILKSGHQPESFYKNLWDTIKSGKVWRGEFNNKTKSGSIIWEAASIAPIQDDSGKIVAFVAVKEDTTARRTREDYLRALKSDLEKSNQELENYTKELKLFNNAAIGREERMIELKKEINHLSEKLNLKPPYDLSFLESSKEGV